MPDIGDFGAGKPETESRLILVSIAQTVTNGISPVFITPLDSHTFPR